MSDIIQRAKELFESRYHDEPWLAQALAEEEYQYGVSYIGMNHGGLHIEWVEPTGDPEFDKALLRRTTKRWEKRGQSPKVVRRRVSKPELANEAN